MQRINKVWLAVLVCLSIVLVVTLGLFSPAHKTIEQPLYGGLLPTQTDTLSQVEQGKTLVFPADHQAHPNYAIEWWYFTANLTSEQGVSYGLQYTLFRFNQANKRANEWANGQMFMAHASLHTPNKHYFEERFAHGGHRHVGVTAKPLSIRMDDWLWQAQSNELLPATLSLALPASSAGSQASLSPMKVSINLELTATGPVILQGDAGFSQKSTLGTHASFYYSQPFINVTGKITEYSVTNKTWLSVSGQGWFDHEWTSQLLDDKTLGWDWFSIHLDDGSKLMAFRMRLKQSKDFVTGTLINPDGSATTLPNNTLKLTPLAYETDLVNDKEYPTLWSLEIPQHGITIKIAPQKQQQWNTGRFQYYEGAIEVNGTHSGKGFMELTGY